MHFNTIDQIEHLSEEKLLLVFRIIQELLVNCRKHAKAKNFYLNISYNKLINHFIIIIDDDGVGCDFKVIDNYRHYGLKIISDRLDKLNGCWKIKTSINEGFHILINIPDEKGDMYDKINDC